MDKKTIKKVKKLEKFNKNPSKNEILDALYKKALGYETDEIIEEYSLDEQDNEKLVKKKITKKIVPSDTQAVKVIMELESQQDLNNIATLTDEELEKKIDEILLKLKEK